MWGCRLFNGEGKIISQATAQLEQAKAAAGSNEAASSAAEQAFAGVMSTIQYSDNSPHIFHAAAIASAILGVYCLTLPKTTPPAKGEPISVSKVLGVDAWALLKDKSFFVFAIASFLICIPLAATTRKGMALLMRWE